ncbi:MAG: tetratricopeptide repeat protein, partial [Nitrosomonas sp.]|nr:tetratricopeptide repeat protein [Nitrosomonas sp.]
NLGLLVAADSGRRNEAEALYQEALTTYRELAKANSSVGLPYVARTLNNLGLLVAADSGHRDEAEKHFKEALTIRRDLAKANPSVYLPDVAYTLGALGYSYLNWGQPRKAIPYLQEASEHLISFSKHAPQVFDEKLAIIKQQLQLAKSKNKLVIV